jgi:hypothetical protein
MRLFTGHSREWLASLAGAVLVALCLTFANRDLRDDALFAQRTFRTRQVIAWAAHGGTMADEATGWMRSLVVAQGPLVIFALASLVLVLLMLRL